MHPWEDPYIRSFFTRKIMEWASLHLRDFPWRSNRDSYRVFLSEFLLQRTRASQVDTVYSRFISKFPTEEAFKSASHEQFKSLLQELGLRKRVDFLVKIQNKLKNLNQSFESIQPADLSSWPGVGNYIVSAFRCFARGERIALVDVNVIRVIVRFFKFKSSKSRARDDAVIWEFAGELLPENDCDIYNYALIDFGSMVCKRRHPKCNFCLLKKNCSEYRKIKK
ncbi:hypothetical protein [Candidatus Harpocratesius sp.]